ncbi:hypothetical protein BDV95DRAFT_562105 [Massariosphaeria phaeospora]|uniref:Zn(2)-C6 fungal-type domain-containing protein n=1 Tax=Massariosphaeria phaeospora TaxID=100035 RepID=A0A7C8IBJ8_9PLEO|nr:hypothetical protein BDV95DRAFT_562105 [Massariosphaeria phaeospora]
MDRQPPRLRHADSDGIGPVKRRRPALSCVECRKRKVKCDRDKPCGPCTRTKSPTCTYRPGRHSPVHRAESSTPASAGQDGSPASSPQLAEATFEMDSMMNSYIAPGILGTHGKPKLHPLPTVHSDTTDATTVSTLVEKVRELEGRLAFMTGEKAAAGGTVLPIRDAPTGLAGQFVKSRFYGESHWVNCLEPYDALGHGHTVSNESTNRKEVNKSSELWATVSECKRVGRALKAARMLQMPLDPELVSSVPQKDTCDQLVQCYFRTFEGVFRVLHIPTFQKEYDQYWENPEAAKPSVLMKILMVCAIGVPFYTGERQSRLRAASVKWIQATGSWLSSPHEKSRLNMAGIQIHTLLLLARQVCSVDGDLIWIPAGALLRSAMHLGLHRDPRHFPRISTFGVEMRRRLWATVLEITVQASLDMGMPPMISPDDYDTLPPSNINDEDISEGDSYLDEKPPNVFTQTSFQIALSETLPIRLEITSLVNNLRSDMSYDETLRLGTEVGTVCRAKTQFFQRFLTSLPSANPFQIKLFDTLVKRFVLCLHRPFFAKAKENPRYYYSKKICLDTALAIHAPATHLKAGEKDDWTRFSHCAVGLFKSIFLYSTSTVYLELIAQIEEQQMDSSLFAPLTGPISSMPSELVTSQLPPSQPPLTMPPQFETLRKVLFTARETTEARIRNGETNAKGLIFLTCALARIDALAANTDPNVAVLEGAQKAVVESAEMLKAAFLNEQDVEFEQRPGLEAATEPWRGEGGDVMTGPGTSGVDGLGEAMPEVSWENMNWESILPDETVDYGFGFEGSPESWFLGWGYPGQL